MLFKQNKYTNIYFKIIKRRVLEPAAEGEKHHIIPKSLGGSNGVDNLVKLSYREHYLCHLLLTKMCLDKIHQIKMCWAVHRLTFSKTFYSSHQYELARRIHIANLKDNHHSRRIPDWSKQLSDRMYVLWEQDEERKKKTSERMKNTWNTQRDKLIVHNRANSIKGHQAYREKNKLKIEYKGSYYHSFAHLLKETGVSKHLYKTYYIHGLDPEPRIGTNGPTFKKKGVSA